MGLMQREKGKRFERDIAALLRERWPSALVRRASQAERADNPDVFVEGHATLERCWLELQDAREPRPRDKLVQAERDIAGRKHVGDRWPVVIWHKLRERAICVTTRLWVLDQIRGDVQDLERGQVVTLELGEFLELL